MIDFNALTRNAIRAGIPAPGAYRTAIPAEQMQGTALCASISTDREPVRLQDRPADHQLPPPDRAMHPAHAGTWPPHGRADLEAGTPRDGLARAMQAHKAKRRI